MNELTRRDFLKAGSMAAAGSRLGFPTAPAAALDPSKLTGFVDPLPIPRIAKALGMRANPDDAKQQIPY
jgi:spore coat protein A, manganese oxidase